MATEAASCNAVAHNARKRREGSHSPTFLFCRKLDKMSINENAKLMMLLASKQAGDQMDKVTSNNTVTKQQMFLPSLTCN